MAQLGQIGGVINGDIDNHKHIGHTVDLMLDLWHVDDQFQMQKVCKFGKK